MGNVSVTGRAWYSFNIKPAVLKWKDGTHDAAKGLMIRNLNESNSGCYKVFNSTEWGSSQNSSQMPYVTLSWNANTPSGITNNSVYYFQNVCSGKYLDIQNNGTSNNTPTIQNSLSYAPSQRFKLVRDGSGYYRIHVQNTTAKRVLLLNTSNQVVLSDDCTNDRALWRIKDEGGGCYSFINKANESTSAYAMSNMGSGSSGAQVKGETYTNATRLRWKVHNAISGITLNKSSAAMAVNQTLQLTANLLPAGVQSSIDWSSSDTRIATVSSSGLVSAHSTGSTIITAKTGEGGYTASCSVTVLENFNYTSSNYNADLALKCSEYAMLAYDEMGLNSSGLYVDTGTRKTPPSPEALINKLQTDKFGNIISRNYGDEDEHNVSYVLANKEVFYQGSTRTLVTIVIRGTDGGEWQGNMDVTGSSYNPSLNDHYSFKQAETDLRTNTSSNKGGLTKYLSDYGITNPVYLITGHSRGAAVANLLAETLTAAAGAPNVFAYTFATPNNTKAPNTSRTNIFNFSFNDDFVPQVPLTAWGYGKHGITFTVTAEDLYANNTAFKNDMDRYTQDSRGKSNATFTSSGTSSLLNYVSARWGTVQEYYEEVHLSGANNNETLYTFFRGTVAPAAMGGNLATVELLIEAIGLVHTDYTTIATFFVSGSGAAGYDDYIYNAHHAFTYYTAIKYSLFV